MRALESGIFPAISRMSTMAPAGQMRLLLTLVALLPPFGALLLELLLSELIQPSVWFLFFPAVFFSFWIGGVRAGLAATVISTLLVLWILVPRSHALPTAPAPYLPAAIFIATGVVFGAFHRRLRTANLRNAEVLAAVEQANEHLVRAGKERRVFAALIENSSDFIGIADPEGRPLYLNPGGRRMVGLPADFPVESTQISDYYPTEQRAFAEDVIVPSMLEKDHWQGETYFRNWRTNEAIPVSDTHFIIRDPTTSEILGMGTVTRDISAFRRAQDELQRANEEVTRLYEKSKELDTLRTQFFALVSHELRTPLSLVLGPAERLLATSDPTSPVRVDLEVIVRNARTLLGYVNDLLDVARIDAGKLTPEYAETNVATVVRLVADHFAALASEQRITFSIEAPPTLAAQADVEKLQRIVMNLLSNAFKFTSAAGHVRLSLREVGDCFVVEVGDSGHGIPVELRDQVFERFRQLEDPELRSHEGTGLGLSIVKDFVSLLGGRVEVSEAPEGGALFLVELPRRAPRGASVRPRVGEPAAPAAARSAVSLGPAPPALPFVTAAGEAPAPLVLVVEDNREMNAFIAQALSRDGFRVAVAFDGAEGLERITAERPDLVLTDIMMPGGGGEHLLRALRAKPELGSMPIVILSARADDELRVRLLREGAQDYLTKPFSTEELCARVRSHVARKLAEEKSHALRLQFEALAQSSMSISEAIARLPETSVRAVFATIAQNAQSLTKAEYAAIGIGGDATHPFDTWVSVGISEELIAQIGHPPRPVGLLGLVGRQNVRLRDLQEHLEYRGVPSNHPVMHSFLGVPIRFRGRPVGNLYLANKLGASEFSEQDERLLDLLAARAGAAIETARLYATERNERAWLQAVVDQMPEGVVLMDAQGKVTAENRAALAMMAPRSGERDPFGNLVSLDLRLASGEALPAEELPIVKSIVRAETTHAQELLAQRADGQLVPLLVSAAPILASGGELLGAAMVLKDMTALKELERLREEWASIVAHDLQQPVNAIVLWADLLLRAELDDQARDDARQVRAAAKQLGRMVSDLTDATQIETSHLQVSLERLELGSLVRQLIERMPDAAPRTKLRTPVGQPLFILGDAGRLEQVLTNLISNAVKYGAPNSDILVDVAEAQGKAEVSVTNRGPGIPEDELPFVFDRYVRSRAAKASSTKGSGLGLYIAKGLIQAHGGKIWAESEPDKTTIRWAVPLDSPPLATNGTSAAASSGLMRLQG